MSAKQAIKQIVPRPLWAKLQSVKETHNGKSGENTEPTLHALDFLGLFHR